MCCTDSRKKAITDDRWIFVVEGEKAADRLTRADLVGTCSPHGAGKWVGHDARKREYEKTLTGARVAILVDNDDAGRSHASDVARSLYGKAADLKVIEFPELDEKADVFDWFESGHTASELLAINRATPSWVPPADNGHKPALAVVPAVDHPIPSAPFGGDGDGAAPTDDEPKIVFTRASSVTIEPVRWLWKARIPLGAVSLLVGRGGLGKTTIAISIAARVTRGICEGDRYEAPADVLMASAEDHPGRVLVPRFKAAGADLDRVHFVHVDLPSDETERDISLPVDIPKLNDALEPLNAAMLIFDPVVAYLPQNVDSHRQQDVRRVLSRLGQLGEDHDLAVWGIMHLNKSDRYEVLDRISGSNAFGNAARSVFAVAPDREDETKRVLGHAKCNLAPLAPSLRYRLEECIIDTALDGDSMTTTRIEWLGETDQRIDELLETANPEERSAVTEAKEWLREELGGGSRPSKEVAKSAADAGISVASFRRAKTQLGVHSRKLGAPGEKGSQWVLELPTAEIPEGAQTDSKMLTHGGVNTFDNVEHLRGQEGASGDGEDGTTGTPRRLIADTGAEVEREIPHPEPPVGYFATQR